MLLLLLEQPMPKWNTSQAAFSPLNRHTDRKLALFRYEAGVAPSTSLVQRIAGLCGELYHRYTGINPLCSLDYQPLKKLANSRSRFCCLTEEKQTIANDIYS